MLSEIPDPNPWSMAPFAALLLAMAAGPVLAPRWWSRNYPTVALGLGALTVAYYWHALHALARMGESLHEYVSFVALVGGLFIVAGGIHIGIKGRGGPGVNVLFLLAGALLANVLGTTGAAMLLIRPWLRLNLARREAYHVVFFIFLVANTGGGLTPIGDPPLFLGYLQGVPFWWVARHCWPMWLTGVGLLLGIFYVVDRRAERRAPVAAPGPAGAQGWRLEGGANLFFLAVMLGAVFVDHPIFLREGLMAGAAIGSYCTTKKSVHAANSFNFHPLQEVAILFAGIFATMMPALDWLGRHAGQVLGAEPSPGVFFWGTGLLSSLLDNAPTYLAFFRSLTGMTGAPDTATLLEGHAGSVAAISVAAVFFGAATYIGNGPNLMIKAMADEEKIRMPSFGALIYKYAAPCLLPVLALVWLLFFRT